MPLAKGASCDVASRIRNWDNSLVGSFKEMSRWKNENGPPFIHFEAFAEPIYCDIDDRFQTIRPELQGFQIIFSRQALSLYSSQ
jgi:hypothetical protein